MIYLNFRGWNHPYFVRGSLLVSCEQKNAINIGRISIGQQILWMHNRRDHNCNDLFVLLLAYL